MSQPYFCSWNLFYVHKIWPWTVLLWDRCRSGSGWCHPTWQKHLPSTGHWAAPPPFSNNEYFGKIEINLRFCSFSSILQNLMNVVQKHILILLLTFYGTLWPPWSQTLILLFFLPSSAKPKLKLQFWLRLALISFSPTHPKTPTHSGKVRKIKVVRNGVTWREN